MRKILRKQKTIKYLTQHHRKWLRIGLMAIIAPLRATFFFFFYGKHN